MRIENVRLGHAANSSSTHSILIGNRAASTDDWDGRAYFGWEDFTLASRAAKATYLAATLYAHLLSEFGHAAAVTVASEWAGVPLPRELDEDGYNFDIGVDHQSHMAIPSAYGKYGGRGGPSKEFFDELLAYYLRTDLSIHGGNDNSERETAGIPHKVPTESYDQVCRRDGKYWVLFNKKTGCKIRLTFDDAALPYTKADRPELVDVKITDYCPFGCRYCYQGSTPQGKHAEFDQLQSLAYRLSELECFEVAFGGGEPTLHPQFAQLLGTYAGVGIVPNFTTFHMGWMRDPEILRAVHEHVGRFAVSVDDAEKVHEAASKAKEYGLWQKLSFHYVMGTSYGEEAVRIVKAAESYGHPIVLLGYKLTGRGEEFRRYRQYNNELRDMVRDRAFYRIGIDTPLANEWRGMIEAQRLERLVTFAEGAFSMYADMVAGYLAPSSYCRGEDRRPFPKPEGTSSHVGKDWIQQVFLSF